jgi:hypothetical protein
MLKICSKCHKAKPLDSFAKWSFGNDGHKPHCKVCGALATKAWSVNNKERKRAADAQYRDTNRASLIAWKAQYRKSRPDAVKAARRKFNDQHRDRVNDANRRRRLADPARANAVANASKKKNPDKYRALAAAWRVKNPDRVNGFRRKWASRNVPSVNANTARRRASKLQATPLWADREAIARLYAEAQKRTTETGIEHHVDHIVPLRSAIVCGLHCEANLQVLPGPTNVAKSNRYWPDMPNAVDTRRRRRSSQPSVKQQSLAL